MSNLTEKLNTSIDKMDEMLLEKLMKKSGLPRRAAKRLMKKWDRKARADYNKKVRTQGLEAAIDDLDESPSFMQLLEDSGMGEYLFHMSEYIDRAAEERKEKAFSRILNSKV